MVGHSFILNLDVSSGFVSVFTLATFILCFFLKKKKKIQEAIISSNDFLFITFNTSQHLCSQGLGLVWFVVFNATFNNILATSWRSVLLVEETGVSGETTESHKSLTIFIT